MVFHKSTRFSGLSAASKGFIPSLSRASFFFSSSGNSFNPGSSHNNSHKCHKCHPNDSPWKFIPPEMATSALWWGRIPALPLDPAASISSFPPSNLAGEITAFHGSACCSCSAPAGPIPEQPRCFPGLGFEILDAGIDPALLGLQSLGCS